MPGSSNLLQWNPSAVNQETDSQYASDSARTGGAGVDSVFASALANKLFFQVSTFVAAFGQMMANKGYGISDASLSTLTGVLANVLTSADQRPPLKVITYAAAPTFDASTANGFEIVLTGNVTAPRIVNVAPGQVYPFILVQDANGNRSFAWPGNVSGATAPDPTPNAVSVMPLVGRSDGSLHAFGPMTVS